MSAKVRFVYVDLGGVLADFPAFYEKLCQLSGKTLDEVKEVYTRYDYPTCRGVVTPKEFFGLLAGDLGVSFPVADMEALFLESFKPILPMHALVTELASTYPVGLATNILKNKLQLLSAYLPPITFDVMVCSCDIGSAKPDPEFYAFAQSYVACKPQEVLFIDDHEENIDAAKQFGWQGFVFNSANPEKSIQELHNLL